MLFERRLPEHHHTLVGFALATGAQEDLQSLVAEYGFSQLATQGERIVYVLHPAKGRSRVVTDALRGGARTELGSEGSFAQLQGPQLSPDGRYATYTDETTLVLHALGDGTTRTLTTCKERHCPYAWDTATSVVVHDGDVLSRASLDGTLTPLATKVEGMVVAGARG